jgi:hypothetical protein
MQYTNKLLDVQCLTHETMQILSETSLDVMENKGFIHDDV